jgi:23S rRNA pseudouridine1911/1915/1917 synthase
VILAAKSDEAQWRLALQFERRRIHKEYLAVIEGEPQLDSDRIDGPIGAHPRVRQRYAVRPGFGRPASTVYHVKERLKGFAFLLLKPATGRTHQLRVHMSSIRHPIVGDTLYGARKITVGELLDSDDDTPAIPRFALHAHLIRFRHPISGKEMTIQAELPEDIENLLEILRKRAGK